MRIVIAGGHGQIARQFGKLVSATGHQPVGMIRNPEQVPDLEADGVEPAMIDLEAADVASMTDIVKGADVVVFAAGGGADGDASRKETVDKGAAIMLADAAEAAGVRRYVMVSSMGTEDVDADPGSGSGSDSGDIFQVYLRAKQAAELDLKARDLDWTIVRPGRLTDDVPTGLVQIGRRLERGSVTRGDVAHVLAEVIETEATSGMTFEVLGGDRPIAQAIADLCTQGL